MARVLAEFASSFRCGARSLVVKEMRSRSRGWRPIWLLTVYLVALSAALAGFLALVGLAAGTVHPSIGLQLFSTLSVGSVLLMAFITPTLTVGAISGERERRTLDLLLTTRASALGLVSGKLMGSLVYILFLLVASLPAFALAYLFGGVPLLYLGMALAVAGVTAVAHAAIGLFFSALLKRTALASVLSYLVVLAVVFGLPLASMFLSVAPQMQKYAYSSYSGPPPAASPPAYLYANPLTSLSSVLPAGSGGYGTPMVGDILGLLFGGSRYGTVQRLPASTIAQSVYVVGQNPTTGEPQVVVAWAPWIYHFTISAVATLLCLLLAALAVAPVKPWQAWRARRRHPRPLAPRGAASRDAAG